MDQHYSEIDRLLDDGYDVKIDRCIYGGQPVVKVVAYWRGLKRFEATGGSVTYALIRIRAAIEKETAKVNGNDYEKIGKLMSRLCELGYGLTIDNYGGKYRVFVKKEEFCFGKLYSSLHPSLLECFEEVWKFVEAERKPEV